MSSTQTVLIAAHPDIDEPIKEVVQLDSEEAYRLYIALRELYQQ